MTVEVGEGIGRRGALAAVAVAGLTVAVGATAAAAPAASVSETDSLLAAFNAAWVTRAGSTAIAVDRRLAFLTDDAIVIDDDTPYPLSKAEYADHAAFHIANWERIEWLTHNAVATLHGESGVVSTNYIVRGKPKDAGFRLRAGYCTAVCVRGTNGWRAICVHMAPLSGQLTDASPS